MLENKGRNIFYIIEIYKEKKKHISLTFPKTLEDLKIWGPDIHHIKTQ